MVRFLLRCCLVLVLVMASFLGLGTPATAFARSKAPAVVVAPIRWHRSTKNIAASKKAHFATALMQMLAKQHGGQANIRHAENTAVDGAKTPERSWVCQQKPKDVWQTLLCPNAAQTLSEVKAGLAQLAQLPIRDRPQDGLVVFVGQSGGFWVVSMERYSLKEGVALRAAKGGKILPVQDDGEALSMRWDLGPLLVFLWRPDREAFDRAIDTLQAPQLFQCALGDASGCYTSCFYGHAGSCFALGEMADYGYGMSANHTAAISFWKRACADNNTPGCSRIAATYNASSQAAFDRRGPLWASEAMRRRCVAVGDQEDPTVCISLGHSYMAGKGPIAGGLPRQPRRAAAAYNHACKLGVMAGCSAYALILERGEGIASDPERARILYERSCYAEQPWACMRVALMYDLGDKIPKHLGYAFEFYRLGCTQGLPDACDKMKAMFEERKSRAPSFKRPSIREPRRDLPPKKGGLPF